MTRKARCFIQSVCSRHQSSPWAISEIKSISSFLYLPQHISRGCLTGGWRREAGNLFRIMFGSGYQKWKYHIDTDRAAPDGQSKRRALTQSARDLAKCEQQEAD